MWLILLGPGIRRDNENGANQSFPSPDISPGSGIFPESLGRYKLYPTHFPVNILIEKKKHRYLERPGEISGLEAERGLLAGGAALCLTCYARLRPI